jgi:hypothetical protein
VFAIDQLAPRPSPDVFGTAANPRPSPVPTPTQTSSPRCGKSRRSRYAADSPARRPRQVLADAARRPTSSRSNDIEPVLANQVARLATCGVTLGVVPMTLASRWEGGWRVSSARGRRVVVGGCSSRSRRAVLGCLLIARGGVGPFVEQGAVEAFDEPRQSEPLDLRLDTRWCPRRATPRRRRTVQHRFAGVMAS